VERRCTGCISPFGGQPLHGGDLVPAGLGGEHRAGLDRLAVEQHRAGAAGGGVAADVGRGEVGHVAQEVHEQQRSSTSAVMSLPLTVRSTFTGYPLSAPRLWAALIAVHTRCGVAGMSMCRTPRCATASMTAFWTAGVAPIVPASPMPLTPSGFTVVGVSLPAARSWAARRGDGGVVGQRGGQRVAVGVVEHLFEQRLGGALGDAAVPLALGEHRVEHRARVVDGHVPQQRDLAGLGVHLDHGHVRAEREGGPSR
jgi:hypothetical protein